jgi:hypothetical protein
MIRTIVIGSCVSVQGLFVRALDNGRIVVSVGNTLFEGLPVSGQSSRV